MIGKLILIGCLALTQVGARHIESELCPPSEIHWLLPHEWDCTKFYYCEYGLRWETPTSCAPGTEFSYRLQVCVHPASAECNLPNEPPTDAPPETDPPAPTATTTAPAVTTTTEAAATQPPVQATTPGDLDNGCPADFEIHQLLPHETNCNQFYYCNFGELVLRTCPEGTYFNPELQVCDWPWNVECAAWSVDDRCPTDFEIELLLPNPDCGKFYQCVHGNVVERDCPAGLHFNAATQQCDWPADAGCEAVVVPPPDNDNGCPADYDIDLLLPHPDCGKFYQCVHGDLVERDCPAGLHFNAATQQCDWPADAGCDAGVVPPPDNDNGCPTDYNIDLLLPHPDCGKFYQCVHGDLVERDCPAGLHFNAATQQCDWPADAGCDAGVVPPPDNDNGCPSDYNIDLLLPHPDCGKFYQCVHGDLVERDCPAGLHFNAATQQCDWPADAGCDAGVVPPPDNDNGCPTDYNIDLLLPHPDCGKFYQCVHGDLVERDCPAGLHFNAATQQCDWPTDAGCDAGVVPPPDNDNGCPTDYNIDLLLPHPDCGKFYQCVHGDLVERDCPAGLHFNAATQQCDWPADAGCDAGLVPPPDNENGCPTDYTIDLLLPHPDCGKFYQCVHGDLVERDCPAGLHFNAATQQCDWPADAGCDAGVVPPPDNENGCPTDYTIDLLLPHPDCGKFYQCVHGDLVERDCPAGLHFNAATQECDWPADAGCDAGVVPPPDNENGCPTDYTIDLLLPHPDCGKFYQCVHGDLVERDCPAGLHFNAATQQCDWPADAGCDAGVVPPPDNENGCPTDYTIDLLLPHPDCGKFYQCVHGDLVERDCPAGLHFNEATQQCDWPADAGCEAVVAPPPQPGCVHDVLLPHPDDCGKFYYCVHGDLVERDCPAGLHFNAALQQCDWPADAGCEAVVAPPPQPGCEHDVLLPHPDDCGKFYYCVHGDLVERDCPAGLHFNAALQVCDWPANAGCSDNGVTNRCDECNTAPWAHETDCDKFWRCDGSNEVLVTCSLGLHFNSNTGSCDYICNADCRTEL